VTIEELARRTELVLDEVERAVVGKRHALELVLLGMLADGHVLLEDFPGLAKTLIARAFAQVTSIGFTRIQFTPDLMPSDVTGSSIFNQREVDFEFRRARSSRTCCWLTRSTALRRRRRPPCSRRCRSGR
jgi:MoxR-like ATPase